MGYFLICHLDTLIKIERILVYPFISVQSHLNGEKSIWNIFHFEQTRKWFFPRNTKLIKLFEWKKIRDCGRRKEWHSLNIILATDRLFNISRSGYYKTFFGRKIYISSKAKTARIGYFKRNKQFWVPFYITIAQLFSHLSAGLDIITNFFNFLILGISRFPPKKVLYIDYWSQQKQTFSAKKSFSVCFSKNGEKMLNNIFNIFWRKNCSKSLQESVTPYKLIFPIYSSKTFFQT